jgi:hypothetical protein
MVTRVSGPKGDYRPDDSTFFYDRLRSQWFEAVETWIPEHRQQLRLALESVPHLLKGDLLCERNSPDSHDRYSPSDAVALEVVFRKFAVAYGLLSRAYFQQPENTILHPPNQKGPRLRRLELL